MFRLLAAALVVGACAGQPLYELSGQVESKAQVYVSLYGATSPFAAAGQADADGRFTFKKLPAGEYTLAILIPSRGEARRTVEVGPGAADAHGRVAVALDLKESDFVYADAVRRRNSISASQLAIPDRALRQYALAQRDLGRRDADSAVKRLEEAVAMAPRFSAAWNELGTIAYQTRRYPRAEQCFREALKQDPQAFEPLVNLGGALISRRKFSEAWEVNLEAVLARPNDALANSQFGLAYFGLENYDLALKYLDRARRIDPSHFSHPQLVMAEIHLRRNERRAAADDLEDFLTRHPDWPQAAKMRETIASLRD